MKRSDAIKEFLSKNTHSDLAGMYRPCMEVQVNVAQDHGDPIKTEHSKSKVYSDNIETWRPFRMPAKAMSEPEDNDCSLDFNPDRFLGVGMTGWNWKDRCSEWVAYDFDSMMGHSDKHAQKLSDEELLNIQKIVSGLPYVTVRKSTSGHGLHLYVTLDSVPTANHLEHAALARAILSMMSGVCGYNFSDKVDIAGGNMWVWHRKMKGTEGLKLIRQGSILKSIPTNWRDHLKVISKSARRVVSDVGVSDDLFAELSGRRSKVKLDDEHLALIKYHQENNLQSWWDADNHMFVTHTTHLKKAHEDLKLRGEFHTIAEGTEFGSDHNCFLFACRSGVWVVRRYGMGTQEHEYWTQDGKGFTRTYFNRDLTLDDIARMSQAIELEMSGYQFKTAKLAMDALKKIRIELKLPPSVQERPMKVRESKNEAKIVMSIQKFESDNASEMDGWLVERGQYKRVVSNTTNGVPDESSMIGDYDNMIRHVVSENNEDLGWMVTSDGIKWRNEPLSHVKLLLLSLGISAKDSGIVLGRCVSQSWMIVNLPFEPEYPGERRWNRSSARFKIAPSTEGESLSYPTWQRILDHCGSSLDGVLKSNPTYSTGGEYLKHWFACLVQHPKQPLPFLALHGDQNTGKSTLHEAFCQFVLAGGYMDGNIALTSKSHFNGELQDVILCILEETNLRDRDVYNRIKEWVTSPNISIHIKGQTPYKAPNYTHWIQCVNDPNYIPVFEGDKRVTVLHVPALPESQLIPRRDLWQLLSKEAPDFLAALLSVELADSRDRLMLPVIESTEKSAVVYSAMTPVERFFTLETLEVPGAMESADDVYRMYLSWAGDTTPIGKNKFGTLVPSKYPRGRVSGTGNQHIYYGNITLNKENPPEPSTPFYSAGITMKRKEDANSP